MREAAVNPVQYVFHIDVFRPETLPMGRLADYLSALARMMGSTEHTHFVAVEPGSAQLRTEVDPVDAPKVETRLNGLSVGEGPKDGLAAKQHLDDLLANDNAVGVLTEVSTNRVVIAFAGRNRPKPLSFPSFREDTTIDGILVSIGGRDTTAHAQLQDGDVLHTGVSMPRGLARELAPLLYGPVLRLHGSGRFERQASGQWKMSDFKVDRYDRLDARPISDVLNAIRSVPGNGLMEPDAYSQMVRLREGGEENEQ